MTSLVGQLAAIMPEAAGELMVAARQPAAVVQQPRTQFDSNMVGVGRFDGVLTAESYANIRAWAEQQRRSAEISESVLMLRSPGGTIDGGFETAEFLRRLAATKPLTVLVDGLCCSGGYLIASAATKLYAGPSAIIGSCGVIQIIVDNSAALQMAGISVIAVATADAKADGYPGQPVTEAAIARAERMVNDAQRMFMAEVQRSPRMTAEQLVHVFSTADVWHAPEAKKLGLIDDVRIAEDVLAEIFEKRVVRSYGHLSGEEAVDKYDELVEKRSGEDYASLADDHHHDAIRKKYPALAAAADKHRKRYRPRA